MATERSICPICKGNLYLDHESQRVSRGVHTYEEIARCPDCMYSFRFPLLEWFPYLQMIVNVAVWAVLQYFLRWELDQFLLGFSVSSIVLWIAVVLLYRSGFMTSYYYHNIIKKARKMVKKRIYVMNWGKDRIRDIELLEDRLEKVKQD